MTCRMFKNPFTTANTHGLPLSLSKAHMTRGDLQSLNELFLASERMVVCKFRPPSILTAIVTLLRSFYCFNKEFPKCDAGSEKNVFLLLGLPVPHFHFQWNMSPAPLNTMLQGFLTLCHPQLDLARTIMNFAACLKHTMFRML